MQLLVTGDELQKRMEKLNQLTPLKSFQNLQRIVSQKAENVSFDELRVQCNAQQHQLVRIETRLHAHGISLVDETSRIKQLQELLEQNDHNLGALTKKQAL